MLNRHLHSVFLVYRVLKSTLQHSPFDVHICTLMVEVAVRGADLLIRSDKAIQLVLPNWRVPIGTIWGSVSFPRILPNHDLPISGRPALPLVAPTPSSQEEQLIYQTELYPNSLKKTHLCLWTMYRFLNYSCHLCQDLHSYDKRWKTRYLGAIFSCIKAYQLL